jgi:hypothetical protein
MSKKKRRENRREKKRKRKEKLQYNTKTPPESQAIVTDKGRKGGEPPELGKESKSIPKGKTRKRKNKPRNYTQE